MDRLVDFSLFCVCVALSLLLLVPTLHYRQTSIARQVLLTLLDTRLKVSYDRNILCKPCRELLMELIMLEFPREFERSLSKAIEETLAEISRFKCRFLLSAGDRVLEIGCRGKVTSAETVLLTTPTLQIAEVRLELVI